MRKDVRQGRTFPDYELADQSGKRHSLSELQGGNPMVLHLSRGDPKEHQFVRQLVDAYPRISKRIHTIPDFDLASPGLKEAWERGDRDQFLVDTLEEPIRNTEGKSIGIKR